MTRRTNVYKIRLKLANGGVSTVLVTERDGKLLKADRTEAVGALIGSEQATEELTALFWETWDDL